MSDGTFLVRLKCYYAFFLMCCGCDTSYIVSVHIQCQASIHFRCVAGHSRRMRLAKQEKLTPPGHLVSPLDCRGPWMSTVMLYCWCQSDSASVLLNFTFPSCPVSTVTNAKSNKIRKEKKMVLVTFLLYSWPFLPRSCHIVLHSFPFMRQTRMF